MSAEVCTHFCMSDELGECHWRQGCQLKPDKLNVALLRIGDLCAISRRIEAEVAFQQQVRIQETGFRIIGSLTFRTLDTTVREARHISSEAAQVTGICVRMRRTSARASSLRSASFSD